MFSFPSDLITYLNGVLIIWFLIDLYFAYKNGLLMLLVSLAGSLVAFFIAWLFAPIFAELFNFVKLEGHGVFTIEQTMAAYVNRLIWVFIIFIAIKLFLMLITPLVKFISKIPLIKQVNSLIGAIFGVLLFGIKLLVLSYFLALPLIRNGQEIIEKTFLGKWVEINQPFLSFVDESIMKNTAIQNIIKNQALSPAQHEAIQDWLKDHGFTEQEILEFLSQYE